MNLNLSKPSGKFKSTGMFLFKWKGGHTCALINFASQLFPFWYLPGRTVAVSCLWFAGSCRSCGNFVAVVSLSDLCHSQCMCSVSDFLSESPKEDGYFGVWRQCALDCWSVTRTEQESESSWPSSQTDRGWPKLRRMNAVL